jgi:Dolichyl-phosphate-mannose-protein mannosyltransferase
VDPGLAGVASLNLTTTFSAAESRGVLTPVLDVRPARCELIMFTGHVACDPGPSPCAPYSRPRLCARDYWQLRPRPSIFVGAMIAEFLTYLRSAPTRLAWFLVLSAALLIQTAAIGVLLWSGASWARATRASLGRSARLAWADARAALRAEPAAALWAVFGMTVVGLVVRAPYLSVPMRGDESNTYFGYISKSWWTAISAYPVPNNHVLNSVLAKVAITVLGVSPWSLRLPAFIAGVVLIPAAYWCARAQYSVNAALIGTTLVTASAPLITYSVNGRGYTLLCLTFLLSVAIAGYALRRRNIAAWCAFAVVNAIGFFAIPIMFFPFGGTMIWLAASAGLDERGADRRMALIMLAAAGIGTLVLTLDFYIPVAISRGYRQLLTNGDIVPQPWPYFWSALPAFLKLYLDDMIDGLPRVVAWIVGLGTIGGLIMNARVSRWRVPLLIPALMWAVLVFVIMHRISYTRIYIYLAIIAFLTAGAGLAGWSRWRVGRTGIASIAAAIVLAAAFVRSPAMADSFDEFNDAPGIATLFRGMLRPGDAIVWPWWINNGLRFYMLRAGADTVPLDVPPETAQRLVVITRHPGLTGLDSLLDAQGVDTSTLSAPSQPVIFPASAVYVMARRTLPVVSATACRGQPLLLDLTTDSGYSLNHWPHDSAGLSRWITTYLPQFPPTRRQLVIRVSVNTRARDVAWIAAAAEAQGAHVFSDDGSCHLFLR